MTAWMVWLVTAGAMVILELLTGTFYLLVIALGLAVAGFAAMAGSPISTQLWVAGLVGVIGTYFVWRSRLGKSETIDPVSDPNINLDIGQTLAVKEWDSISGGPCTARAMYRGALWDVELASGATAEPGMFVIKEVRGSRLIVTNNKAN